MSQVLADMMSMNLLGLEALMQLQCFLRALVTDHLGPLHASVGPLQDKILPGTVDHVVSRLERSEAAHSTRYIPDWTCRRLG